jgi:hypothetical protein
MCKNLIDMENHIFTFGIPNVSSKPLQQGFVSIFGYPDRWRWELRSFPTTNA